MRGSAVTIFNLALSAAKSGLSPVQATAMEAKYESRKRSLLALQMLAKEIDTRKIEFPTISKNEVSGCVMV